MASAAPAPRDAFFGELYDIARRDDRVVLLSNDFGAPSLDRFRRDLPRQYFNMGIAEQNMVSTAAGLALDGRTAYLYAIAPFVTLRCFEQLKIDVASMALPVNTVGVGAGFAYGTAGPTHQATEDIAVMRTLPGMTILSAADSVCAAACADITYRLPGPKYLRLDREARPALYAPGADFSAGIAELSQGKDAVIIATGIMVHEAVAVARELAMTGIRAGVIDLYRLKPLNREVLLELLRAVPKVVTLEEHTVNGGLGSLLAEFLADNGLTQPLLRLAIPDRFFLLYGGRDALRQAAGLGRAEITRRSTAFVRER